MNRLSYDFLVVGAGLAGMYCALSLPEQSRIGLLTKDAHFPSGNSLLAQGGIAAAINNGDHPDLHFADTYAAGHSHGNPAAIAALVKEGPLRIEHLLSLGVSFDGSGGKFHFTREAAHSQPRILHAGGDRTGEHLCRVLATRIRQRNNIDVFCSMTAFELLISRENCSGVIAHDKKGQVFLFNAHSVVLATGGLGQLFGVTSNSPCSTGDGFAMAAMHNISLTDMEFIQFHPTVLDHPRAQGFLISEAVRGEGGLLLNHKKERFMLKYHPMGELAPRDIVARAVYHERKTSNKKVFLGVTHLSSGFFSRRFPQISDRCNRLGINPEKELIPVVPAAHYLMGGIQTDLSGRTTLKGLYACGETACTGVHGANRLASNSLLEALVFSHRTALACTGQSLSSEKASHEQFLNLQRINKRVDSLSGLNEQHIFNSIRNLLQNHVGISRNKQGLESAMNFLMQMDPKCFSSHHQLILTIVKQALQRKKSLGAHYRTDSNDEYFSKGVAINENH